MWNTSPAKLLKSVNCVSHGDGITTILALVARVEALCNVDVHCRLVRQFTFLHYRYYRGV